MITLYLDSSAYLKGFRNEEKSEIIHDILEKCENGKLTVVISVWTLAECISVLDKAFYSAATVRRISFDEMSDMITNMLAYSFNNERKGRLVIVEPDAKMIYQSWAYIRWYHLSADDALHTMCATSRQSEALLLADGHFANMLKNPEKIDDPRLLAERPKIEFKVLNLLDEEDFKQLESQIKVL